MNIRLNAHLAQYLLHLLRQLELLSYPVTPCRQRLFFSNLRNFHRFGFNKKGCPCEQPHYILKGVTEVSAHVLL